jgi:hypothetical protein
MPLHLRTQIRNAVADILNGLPTTENRVFVSRVYPMERTSLPGLIIMTESDAVESNMGAVDNGDLVLWSKLQLMVKGYAKGTTNVDSNLDQIENEVRKTLLANPTLGGLVVDTNWQSTTIQIEVNGEQPVGVAEMLFIVDYRVAQSAPDIPRP